MLKMHFPEEAIRHKMNKEGASEKVFGAVFDVKTNSPVPTTSMASLSGSDLVAMHWTPLSGEELDKTMPGWCQLNTFSDALLL
jgi:hypothetical protein